MQTKLRTILQLILMVNKFIIVSIFVMTALPLTNALLFDENIVFNIKLLNQISSPLTIEIASDQSVILVGYSNGSIVSYNLNGGYLKQFNDNMGQIYEISWINDVGFLAFGSLGKIALWNTDGLLLFSTPVSNFSSVQQVTVSCSSVGNFVAVVYPTTIQEYNITSVSLELVQQYELINDTAVFFSGVYSSDHEYLFTTTNSGQMFVYNCTNGNTIGQALSTNDNSNFQSIAPFINGTYLLMNYLSLLYQFSVNSFGIDNQQIGNFQNDGNSLYTQMITCPAYFQIGLSNMVTSKSNYNFNIYSSNFTLVQTLNYFTGQVQNSDCSQNYLLTLDSNGYLALATYLKPIPVYSPQFPRWLIWLIVGCCSLIAIILIVVLMVFCRRQRIRKLRNLQSKSFLTQDTNVYERNFEVDSNKEQDINQKNQVELGGMTIQNYLAQPKGNLDYINKSPQQ